MSVQLSRVQIIFQGFSKNNVFAFEQQPERSKAQDIAMTGMVTFGTYAGQIYVE